MTVNDKLRKKIHELELLLEVTLEQKTKDIEAIKKQKLANYINLKRLFDDTNAHNNFLKMKVFTLENKVIELEKLTYKKPSMLKSIYDRANIFRSLARTKKRD